MSEFRFLCPQCGRAFKEGSNFTECPQCHVPLLTAGSTPADAANLPRQLDIDALMTRVLADQQPGEEIDAALDRVIRRDYPAAHDTLAKLIGAAMDFAQRMGGGTRQEVGQRLAHDRSELEMQPDGTPMVKTFHHEIKFEGMEVTPEQQEEIKQEVEEALRTGKPIERIVLTTGKRNIGCSPLMLLAVLLATVCWSMLAT